MFQRDEQTIFVAGAVGKVECITADSQGDARNVTAIVCHPHPQMGGTMNNKVVHTVARALRGQGCRTLRFNFRGVGKSEGEFDEAVGEVDDLMAVVDVVVRQFPNDPIILAGFSFGSFVAASGLQLCLNLGINVLKLIVIAPPIERMAFGQIPPFQRPVLIIQGDDDEVVCALATHKWVDTLQKRAKLEEACPPTLVRLPVSGHFFHGKLTDLKIIISEQVF